MYALDWIVVALYMLGMLGIGEYYARRNRSAEDYLLGNRRMGSTSVGLSLFASLMSTVTYLAMPGEMIQHGPLASAKILTYPLVYLLLGYLLIPRFMKLRVTSAYEILERRFGLSVRMLGSTMFLALRLLWMSVIIYTTTRVVLVPVAHLPVEATPYACLAMGLTTVIYTSAGGLRAVVMTDAIQSIILLVGALLTVIVITASLGGVGAWMPSHWLEHWDTFEIGLNSDSRMTLGVSALVGILWWLCTGGSDQIAIQRYLATRDAPAARRVLAVSLVTNVVSITLLGFVGLALLGYFQTHPEQLADGVGVRQNADNLFTHFLVIGLPPGVTGLVIAGLLAAAMSSLSSGLNSSCLVIAVDFLGRFQRVPRTEARKIRETKIISWTIGIVIVLLSTLVGNVEGNILEITFKTCNLLMAPLFILFFMALFIPWATVFGTWMAALASTLAAVLVAYFAELRQGYESLGLHEYLDLGRHLSFFDRSFIWILPVSLAAGVLAGCLLSLLPISRRCPMLEIRE